MDTDARHNAKVQTDRHIQLTFGYISQTCFGYEHGNTGHSILLWKESPKERLSLLILSFYYLSAPGKTPSPKILMLTVITPNSLQGI